MTASVRADLTGDDLCGKDAGMTQDCLDLLLKFRCVSYGFPVPGAGAECRKTVGSFVATMKFTPYVIEEKKDDGSIVKNTVYVIFPQELERLIKDPAALRYLENLNTALSEALRTENNFDLYSFTLAEAKGDRRTALRWLGVLLQDTTFAQSHVRVLGEMLTRRGGITAQETRFMDLLEGVNFLLRPDLLQEEHEHYADWLKLYPTVGKLSLDTVLHPTIYHFYTIAYVSLLLEQAGITGKRFASFVPFMFNAEYEFREFPGDRWPLNHPLPYKLDPAMTYKTGDIYTGHVASLFGVDRMNKADTFSVFATKLARDPFGAMQDWFWTSY